MILILQLWGAWPMLENKITKICSKSIRKVKAKIQGDKKREKEAKDKIDKETKEKQGKGKSK